MPVDWNLNYELKEL